MMVGQRVRWYAVGGRRCRCAAARVSGQAASSIDAGEELIELRPIGKAD